MKVLLINPPLMFYSFIYSAIPLLQGQLEANNIDTNILDLNNDFINYIIQPEYLKSTKEYLDKIYKSYQFPFCKEPYGITNKQIKEQKILIEKFNNNTPLLNSIIENAYINYKDFIKNNTDLDNITNSQRITILGFTYAFLPYYPNRIFTSKGDLLELNPSYDYSYKNLMDLCSNKKRNIYIPFFEQKLKEINDENYDIIAITVPFESNFYPAFTLGRILKKNTKAKIIYGGVYISFLIDNIINHPEIFNEYADGFLMGEGEKSIVDYVKATEGKLPIENVSGLVYKKNNKIIKNKIEYIEDINIIHPPSYKGINLKNYMKPQIKLEFSKGCYWGKCCFCYTNQFKRYHILDPKKAVDIIEDLINKYGFNWFSIVDDALSISFAEKFADEIIKRGICINYNCHFRFEKTITYEFLKKMKASGLRGIFFGQESADQRILNMINKGIDIEISKKILENTHKLKIHSSVGFICNFPTETENEFLETINFINENKNNIDNIVISEFSLFKNSPLLQNKDKFQITNIREEGEFSSILYFDAPGMDKVQTEKILKENNLYINSFFSLLKIQKKYNIS